MAKYVYHEMQPAHFEDLVIAVCQRLLGAGVMGFTTGPDGGRDAYFHGTAERYPSSQSPWNGKTVIQSKHTLAPYADFGEKRFFSLDRGSSTLTDEFPKIVSRRDRDELDNYMIFSNRKLTSRQEETIRACLSDRCGIPQESVGLFGIERLESTLGLFPEIAKQVHIDLLDRPLMPTSEEIAEIISAFVNADQELRIPNVNEEIIRVSVDEKNRINQITDRYFVNLERRYHLSSEKIQSFLAHPQNLDLRAKYEYAVEDVKSRLILREADFGETPFGDVIEYLADYMIKIEPVLAENKPLTWAMIYHMYFYCDIGRIPDAEA